MVEGSFGLLCWCWHIHGEANGDRHSKRCVVKRYTKVCRCFKATNVFRTNLKVYDILL